MPPVFSRMFQQMSEAMLGYSDALKIVTTPIPFPYSQMNGFVLYLFGLSWPVMCAVMVPMLEWAAAISFLVVLAFFSIDAIATELQDPFGNDNNDLPLLEIMHKFEYEVESILVLNGRILDGVKGFRSVLTADIREQQAGFKAGVVDTQPAGPFEAPEGGATFKYDAQSVMASSEFVAKSKA